MAGRTLTVYLAADTTKFRTGMASAGRSLDDLDNPVTSFSNKLSGMLGPALTGAAAAAGTMAIAMGVDGVKAAIDDEAAASKLAQTLTNLGLAHDTTAVEAMIDALQRQTGVADEQLRPAFSRLVTTLKDTSAATDTLKLAMDISAGTGKDLDTVVAALSKAYDGNTGALGRLGVGLDTQIIKTGDMDAITKLLAQTFGGQADKAAGTYQGAINRLSVGFDELKESFGAGFLEGLGSADSATGDLTDTMKNLEEGMGNLGATIGETLTTLGDITKGIYDARDAAQDALDAFDNIAAKFGYIGDSARNALGPLGSFLNLVDKIKALGDIGSIVSRITNTAVNR